MSAVDPVLRAGDIRATSESRRSYSKIDDSPFLTALNLGADDEQWCARGVARMTMLAAHNCTGKRCRKRAHAGRDERLNEWGKRRQDKSKPGG